MPKNPLDEKANAANLRILAEEGLLDKKALERGYEVAGLYPDTKDWKRFLDKFLLVLGVVFVVSGIISYFVTQWEEFEGILQMGIVGFFLLAAMYYSNQQGFDRLEGKIGLTVSVVLIGIFLSVADQNYQFFNEPYQINLVWAVLCLVLAFNSRFTPTWFLIYIALTSTITSYYEQSSYFGDYVNFLELPILLWLTGVNIAALIAWETAHQKGVKWLKSRLTPRIIALGLFGGMLFIPIAESISLAEIFVNNNPESDPLFMYFPFIFFPVTLFILYYYSKKVQDQFILNVACFSLVATIIFYLMFAFFGEVNLGEISLLCLGPLMVGLSAVAVNWLRYISETWEAEQWIKSDQV